MENNLEKEFANRKHALAVEELGFDEPCLAYYENFEVTHGRLNDIGKKRYVQAPLKQQVFRWFREKYGLIGHTRESWSFDDTLEFVSQINGTHVNHGLSDKPINRFDSYEEAENSSIDKLIELAKQQDISHKEYDNIQAGN